MTLRDTIDVPPMYFDRQGQPISLKSWCEKFSDYDYRCVAEHFVDGLRIVTLWMGTDADAAVCRGHKPRIFGTAVFGPDRKMLEREYPEREHATEAAALAHHHRVCEKVRQQLQERS